MSDNNNNKFKTDEVYLVYEVFVGNVIMIG